MKIAFNVLNSGLGPNGGSRTVLLCQKTLEKLGHRCDIIGTVDNFTWFEHKEIIPYFPSDLDVVIATACTTVQSTVQSNVNTKAWYIRAHELWAMQEEDLKDLYKVPNVINFVNSRGLQQQISMYGANSKVIYQGIDFDWWEDKNLRPKDKIRIGALYTKQPRKRWKDFVKLAELLGTNDYEYVGIGNAKCDEPFLSDYAYNVGADKLSEIYSSCHIWFAPTDSEGLHNVPMEANLCGCLIVCSDAQMNGMILDYAFSDNTAMVYEARNIEQAADLIRNPNWELIGNMQRHLNENIGTRQKNMDKLVKYLEITDEII